METKTTTTPFETTDIEQMRQEMAALKIELSKQEIVDEQLMRHVMKDRLSWLNSYVIAETVAVPLIIIGVFLIHLFVFTMSPWLLAFTTLMLLGSNGYNWYFTWMKGSSLLQGDLSVLRKRLVGMRHRIAWENAGTLVLIAIWAPWFFLTAYDFTLTLDPSSSLRHFFQVCIIGGAVGCAIGLVLGLRINRKANRTYSDIIAQIGELLTDGLQE